MSQRDDELTDPDPTDGSLSDSDDASSADDNDRRDFLKTTSTVAMLGGLAAGYGTFAVLAGRFVYSSPGKSYWQYVLQVDRFRLGQSMIFRTPAGATVVIARQGERGEADDFIALSSICPHLGCQVHWEAHHDRFFCPCHNGAFDAEGKAIAGPPAAANQELKRFPLKIQNGLLYIEVPTDDVSNSQKES